MHGIVPMNFILPIIINEKICERRRGKSLPIIVRQIRYTEKQEDGEKEIRPFDRQRISRRFFGFRLHQEKL